MGTFYGIEYSEEIDEIYRLARQHIEKYGEEDLYGCLERIFGVLNYAMNSTLEVKKKSK